MISWCRGRCEIPVPWEGLLVLFPIILKTEVGPGDPAAHGTGCLPLLPSGPGGVYRVPLHRAQPLFLIRGSPTKSTLNVSVSPAQRPKVLMWRRGWDSNPRSRCQDACFPSMSIRPLSHLSASRSTRVGILACVCMVSKANGSVDLPKKAPL